MRAGPSSEPAENRISEHVLAVHAQAEAGEGDAELRGRDVAILLERVAQDSLDEPRQPIAMRGAGVDGGARRADDRELRRDEQAVEQDQEADDRELDHEASSSRGLGARAFTVLNSSATPPSSSPTRPRA